MNSLDNVLSAIMQYKEIALSVMAFVMIFISKVVSNEKAGPVISKIQMVLDMIPKILYKVADIVKVVCEILAQAIKSDGFLGKK